MEVTNETLSAADAEKVTLSPETAELKDQIVAALRTVHDPEIPVNIYDLGLIYRVAMDSQRRVEIDMTLTAPGCPVAGEMVNWVKDAVLSVPGLSDIEVNLVFEPPWDQSMMSEETKLELGFS